MLFLILLIHVLALLILALMTDFLNQIIEGGFMDKEGFGKVVALPVLSCLYYMFKSLKIYFKYNINLNDSGFMIKHINNYLNPKKQILKK